MNPEPPATPTPTGQYDFIMTDKPAKLKPGNKVTGNAFIMKLIVIIGGAILIIGALMFITNLVLGSKTNTGDLIGLTQSQNEIVRLSKLGNTAGSVSIRGAAINTQLTVASQQQKLIDYLAKLNHKSNPKELTGKKNTATDKALTAATAATTFDGTYVTTMRTQLTNYATAVRTAYNNASTSSTTERALLKADYNQVVMLLQQWPAGK